MFVALCVVVAIVRFDVHRPLLSILALLIGGILVIAALQFLNSAAKIDDTIWGLEHKEAVSAVKKVISEIPVSEEQSPLEPE